MALWTSYFLKLSYSDCLFLQIFVISNKRIIMHRNKLDPIKMRISINSSTIMIVNSILSSVVTNLAFSLGPLKEK